MLDKGALTGLTVVDLSRLLPGPYCSMVLADHGARVIAIEDRRFAQDPFFISELYRNKEHMCLDLKTEAGLDILYALVRRADVLIEGFRPGVTARLGMDYSTVQVINPRLIYCAITGYGQSGPCRDRAGHDVNYIGTAGVLDLIGPAQGPPSIPGIQIADMAGGMNAVMGILMALIARQHNGEGQYVDISMADSALGLLPLALNWYQQKGQAPQRGDFVLSHAYACYNTYQTADGRAVCVGALEPKFWSALCKHLQREEYIQHQFDDDRRQEIVSDFRKIFASKTLAQWEAELSSLDACCEGVRTLKEALDHPQFWERGMVADFPEEQGGEGPCLGLPISLSQTPGGLRTSPARFGGHGPDILQELGFSQEKIQELQGQGVI